MRWGDQDVHKVPGSIDPLRRLPVGILDKMPKHRPARESQERDPSRSD